MRARIAAAGGRALRALGSPLLVASLLLPLLLVGGGAAAGLVSCDAATGSLAVRVWGAALAAACVLAAVRGVVDRSYPFAVLCVGLLLAMAQAAAASLWRFEGSLDAGVGETGMTWRTERKGPRGHAPSLQVLDVDASSRRARLRLGDSEQHVSLDRDETVQGFVVRVEGPHPAPSFEVRRTGGSQEAAGLVKLQAGAPADYLVVALLPHRLYMNVPATAAVAGSVPSLLHLRVQRGKLEVFEGDVKPEQKAEFDGLEFRYGEGDLWARVHARSATPRWPAALAALLAVAAGVLHLRQRRRPA